MLWEFFDIFSRGCRLKCPCCGHGRLFKSLTTIYHCCAGCGERFEREPGQWLGSVYINLGLTLGFSIAGYLTLQIFTSITPAEQLAIWMPVAAAAPFAFYRLSKGLWVSVVFLGEGLYLRWPSQAEDLTSRDRTGRQHTDPRQPKPVS